MAMDLRFAFWGDFTTDLRDTLYTVVPHLLKICLRLVGGGRQSGEWVASDGCGKTSGWCGER